MTNMPASIASQQAALRGLLKAGVGCSLFNQLGLGRLGSFKDFDILYQGFCRAVPVQGPRVFMDSLAKMLPQQGLAPLQVLQSPNLVSKGKPLAATLWRGTTLPVSSAATRDHLAVEEIQRKRLLQQGVQVKGSFFYLFEQEASKLEASVGQPLPVPLRGWHELVEMEGSKASFLPWKKRHALPQYSALPRGGSRWQWFNAMQDVLKAHGKDVDVLVSNPRTLIDFCLYVSQQSGRFVALREMVPNLKVLALNHYDLGLQRTELGYLLHGLPHVRWTQWMYQPTGIQAWQDDVNIRQRLTLQTDGQMFYEFVPVEDIDPEGRFARSYRRLYAGQVEAGHEYCLIVSNLSGLLGVSTGLIVRVMNTEPLQIVAKGPVVKLNGLGEALREEALLESLSNINSALNGQGVFVRDALMGHVIAERQPFWVLEVSRPLAELPGPVMDSIAKRLHSELDLRSAGYRSAYRAAAFRPPQVHFVPMGTFAAAFTTSPDFSQFDHSPDAALCKRVLNAAWESQMYEAV
ncbi:MAG: GH3 auxin-responsive promoter family protein [Blastochloris viridis]|uniref:GH3 auxin-responsive promoter family protein n=1 Tax=Blastochloris viridis TaxID=1079 RepID=A0A6N4RDR5_BLAVI|nr:MAG: GH3 auxin-responsive promoter family protein [Blastochloris viridis]